MLSTNISDNSSTNINETMYFIINLNFYQYLNDSDYINLLCTNKLYNTLLNDITYKYILYHKFSKNFINKAKTIIISWKDCYLRIKYFEELIVKYSYDLWIEDEYFAYWNYKKEYKKRLNRDEIYRLYYKKYYNK